VGGGSWGVFLFFFFFFFFFVVFFLERLLRFAFSLDQGLLGSPPWLPRSRPSLLLLFFPIPPFLGFEVNDGYDGLLALCFSPQSLSLPLGFIF